MIGWSGSPSRNSTITSCPMRGMNNPPQFFPAQSCETRIQQELFSSDLPSPIPVKLDFHTAVFVRVDFLALFSDGLSQSAARARPALV